MSNAQRVGNDTNMEQLILSAVSKSYGSAEGTLCVLSDVSLTVSAGETVAIVGPSGSGKSTLLHIIGTLERPDAGSVRLGDVEVPMLAGKALATFRATRVGFVFQDHHLLPQLTALENVLLPVLAARGSALSDGPAETRARALLERMGVLERARAFPAQMSGGERQRVAIARALINGATLLLCDEPTGNLDRDSGAAMVSLFLELAQQGVMVVMVTHNLELAARFDRCLELRQGRLCAPADVHAGGAR